VRRRDFLANLAVVANGIASARISNAQVPHKTVRTADLPVQAPTKYETVVNLKTAKAIVPASLLVRAEGQPTSALALSGHAERADATPKFLSALPKKIGVIWPSVKACGSSRLQA
jgi:hypothetical protein